MLGHRLFLLRPIATKVDLKGRSTIMKVIVPSNWSVKFGRTL